jgi:hypothetical protein
MDHPKSSRRFGPLVESSVIATCGGGLIGIGILFDHYARQAPSWVYYPIILGYMVFLGCMMYGEPGVDAKESRGSHRLLRPTTLFVVASMGLILGLVVPQILAYMSYREEHSFALGLLLITAAALSGTIMAVRCVDWKTVPKAVLTVIVIVVPAAVWALTRSM